MPAPSLKNKGSFFANVLMDPGFKRDGYLFGADPGISKPCDWVVIDPTRHSMRVWSKPGRGFNYIDSATNLGSTAFSNGPYWKPAVTPGFLTAAQFYAHGYLREWGVTANNLDKMGTARMMGLHGLVAVEAAEVTLASAVIDVVIPGSAPRTPTSAASWEKTTLEYWGGEPCGVLVQRGSPVHTPARFDDTPSPKHGETVNAYIARRGGNSFGDYEIGKHQPSGGCQEVLGGVAMALQSWTDELSATCCGAGKGTLPWMFWGLAELGPGVPVLTAAERKNLVAALKAYDKAGHVKGLIIGLCARADNATLRDHLRSIAVRDAVQLDASDSVMFGGANKVICEFGMQAEKQIVQNFGLAFFPV